MNEKRQMEGAKQCENEGEIIVITVEGQRAVKGEEKVSEKAWGVVKRV